MRTATILLVMCSACAFACSDSPDDPVELAPINRDVNGDGVDDLVLGAPHHSSVHSVAGAAYVHLGVKGSALDATPDGTLFGDREWALLGRSVAMAGDVNGDGFGDVVIGSGGLDTAFLYLGGAGTTFDGQADRRLTTPSRVFSLGLRVAAAGDVNGDGFDDVIVGAPEDPGNGYASGSANLYFGGATAPALDAFPDVTLRGAAETRLGTDITAMGDVNGDGFADILVSAPSVGKVLLYHGGAPFDDIPDAVLHAPSPNEGFGAAIAAGDFNGDGFMDIAVSSLHAQGPLNRAGKVHLFFGKGGLFKPDADVVLTGGSAEDEFGTSVASLGDVNGDGVGDLGIGAPFALRGEQRRGAIYVYFGTEGASFDATPDGILEGEEDGLGDSLVGGADLNGDGFADVAAAAPYSHLGGWQSGVVHAYLGGKRASFDATPALSIVGAEQDEALTVR